jgi:hypothetical protein
MMDFRDYIIIGLFAVGLFSALFAYSQVVKSADCNTENVAFKAENQRLLDGLHQYQAWETEAKENLTLASKFIWFNQECAKLNSTVQFRSYGYICEHLTNETLPDTTNQSNTSIEVDA